MNKSSNDSAGSNTGVKVVCIPPSLNLSISEKSVLSRGLNFIPVTPTANRSMVHLLLQRFFRTIRWTAALEGPPEAPPQTDIFLKLFSTSKGLQPRREFKSVEQFIEKTKADVTSMTSKPISRLNISPEENKALISLKKRDDIIIKPADKGGAVVVWARDLYAMEIQRQLDNETYYKVDPSYSLDKDVNKIRKTINEFIKNGSLEENATLLNVPNVRQPTFYVLPKIHKEDNPGRPIVSAVSCPTAHISSYLDSIFQPLVQSLPSFIKDSTDALKKIHRN